MGDNSGERRALPDAKPGEWQTYHFELICEESWQHARFIAPQFGFEPTDIWQDINLKIVENISKEHSFSSAQIMLRQVIRYKCIDERRRRDPLRSYEDIENAGVTKSPWDALDTKMLLDEFSADRLDEQDRLLFGDLRMGFTYLEISERHGCSVSTVCDRATRLRVKLRIFLKATGSEKSP